MGDVDTQADREDNFARPFQAEVGHVCYVQTSFDPQPLLGELVVTSPGPGLVVVGSRSTRANILLSHLLH